MGSEIFRTALRDQRNFDASIERRSRDLVIHSALTVTEANLM
jgi:hypothetical protein